MSLENIDSCIDYLIEKFNQLRYDEDGEDVSISVSTSVPMTNFNSYLFDKFDDAKWMIAERIGFDKCSIYDEGNLFMIYEFVRFDDNMEYVEIKMDEEKKIKITYYPSLDELNK